MNRSKLYSNKLCYAREVEAAQALHKQRLATTKPTSQTHCRSKLDFEPPPRMPHVEVKAKKRQIDAERAAKIDRENRMLMDKMFQIMNHSASDKTTEFVPGCRLSPTMMPVTDSYISGKTTLFGAAKRLESLNKGVRRRDYERMMDENMAMLRRIVDRKSVYNREDYVKHSKEQKILLSRIKNDTTAGYLPQGPDGHSIYHKPQSLTDGLPSLSKRPSFDTRGGVDMLSLQRFSGGTVPNVGPRPSTEPGRRRAGGSRKGSSRGSSARKRTSGRRPNTGPGRRDEVIPATFLQHVRSVNGEPIGLRIAEAVTLGGRTRDMRMPGCNGVQVAAVRRGKGAEGAALHVTIDRLRRIAKESCESHILMSAMQRVMPIDRAGNYVRLTEALTEPQAKALGRAVSRFVSVTIKDAKLVVSLENEEIDHGEGPPPAGDVFSSEERRVGEDTVAVSVAESIEGLEGCTVSNGVVVSATVLGGREGNLRLSLEAVKSIVRESTYADELTPLLERLKPVGDGVQTNLIGSQLSAPETGRLGRVVASAVSASVNAEGACSLSLSSPEV